MKFHITGDTHRDFKRLTLRTWTEDDAIIILGDAGINYCLNEYDRQCKEYISRIFPGVLYCVYGNHEQRPSKTPGMKMIDDPEVGGPVWIDPDFPRIRFFCEWGIYKIGELRTLVIGGAYSVDKHYRLMRGARWFEDEQLKDFEMRACLKNARDYEFDLVLTHTCPYSWQPVDLFLRGLDQSTVDNTMEKWLDNVQREVNWKLWLFGHYHADRVELPHVEMFSTEIEALDDIILRWEKYDASAELDWWLTLSPKM